MSKRFKPIYGIEISKIIKYDDDGQAYILASIPSKLKMEGLV